MNRTTPSTTHVCDDRPPGASSTSPSPHDLAAAAAAADARRQTPDARRSASSYAPPPSLPPRLEGAKPDPTFIDSDEYYLDEVSPNVGPITGGTRLTLSGAGFNVNFFEAGNYVYIGNDDDGWQTCDVIEGACTVKCGGPKVCDFCLQVPTNHSRIARTLMTLLPNEHTNIPTHQRTNAPTHQRTNTRLLSATRPST